MPSRCTNAYQGHHNDHHQLSESCVQSLVRLHIRSVFFETMIHIIGVSSFYRARFDERYIYMTCWKGKSKNVTRKKVNLFHFLLIILQ